MKILRKINRRFYNRMFYRAVAGAFGRGVINRHQMSDIIGKWEVECFPEWNQHMKPDSQNSCQVAANTAQGKQ
jgi:hypothetical protein